MLGGEGGKWPLPAPVFLEKSPNMLQDQYKQIFLPFAPDVMLLCCLSVGCCLFKGKDPAITGPPGLPRAESADF